MGVSTEGLFTSSLPELYERFLVEPLFRPFAEELLNRAGLRAGDRLLDVACGSGIVPRVAHGVIGDRGRIVGVDASPGMLGIARAVAPAIEWRQGDAAHLPVREGESFDIVSCHQGLQFFTDKPAAIREMRRVIASGGRVAIGTWRPVAETPLIDTLQRVAERHVGRFNDQRHSLGDAGVIRDLLADGGFRGIRIETVTRTVRMTAGPEAFARLNAMAVAGMAASSKSMNDEQRAEAITAITGDSLEALQSYVVGSDLVFDIASNIAVADA